MTTRKKPSELPLPSDMASSFQDAAKWFNDLWTNSAAAATGAARVPGGSVPSVMMPTLDPKELEKRIADLRSVESWLELNMGLLRTTIQTLELQKQTLQTWQGFQDLGKAATQGATGANSAKPAADQHPFGDAKTAFKPEVWWDALHNQFSQMAAQVSQPAPAPQTDKDNTAKKS